MAHDCDSANNKLISVNDAIARMLQVASATNQTEMLSITAALGRVLAKDLYSDINVPPVDNSAMDGYAIRYADLQDSSNSRLPISQRICAGDVATTLQAGSAARIFTGAPVPSSADTVVMQEACEIKSKHVYINPDNVTVGRNIRRAGEDIRKGDLILNVGQSLRPQDLGLAASVGTAEICVYQRLKVAIFSTGDELCEPGEPLQMGQIYNSNRYTLGALLQSLGCELVDLGIVEDSLEATKSAMLKATQQADLLITSGGVSVGEEDYIRIALEELGQLKLWRINIKPGKPLAFGHIGKMPFLGMPGNPVSVFAIFCILARPFLSAMQGKSQLHARSFNLPTGFKLEKTGSREEYFRVRLEADTSGEVVLQRYANQGSGVLTSTSWADGLACIPANTTVQVGDQLTFYSFAELFSS